MKRKSRKRQFAPSQRLKHTKEQSYRHTKQDRLLSRRKGNTHTAGEVIRTKAVIMIVKHNPIKY